MKTRIKELRLEKKLTQKVLAEYLGANQTMLSKIETGTSIHSNPAVYSLRACVDEIYRPCIEIAE